MQTDSHCRYRLLGALPFRSITAAALTALAVACGIEVGNPHGKKGGGTSTTTAGAFSLAIADAPDDELLHVFFNITAVSVIPLDASGALGQAIELAGAITGKIDVKDLRDGKSLALSTDYSLPIGDYAGVILHLDQANPAVVVDGSGAEHQLPMPGKKRGIFVRQSFSISESLELALTLHVDLRRSIGRPDQNDPNLYAFDPMAHLIRKDDGASIVGKASSAEAAQVCAYLKRRADFNEGAFNRIPRSRPPRSPGEPGDRPPPPPPPPPGDGSTNEFPEGFDAKLPPSFAPDAAQIDDAGSATFCTHAFATAPIKDGAFALHHLWPGSYFLKFYKADGSSLSNEPLEVDLSPGQSVQLP